MHVEKWFALAFLMLLIIIFFSFVFYGMTTPGYYSLDYNVPISQSIASGKFLTLYSTNPYLYFPGSSHIFLALFLLLGIPLNLFGLLGWIVLFIVSKKLGDVFGLKPFMSFIFAASVSTTLTVIRTIGDQSIDKWLCAWFILTVIVLERLKPTKKHALLLGIAAGMLIGTKYSGPLFLLALVPIYWRTVWNFLSPLRFLISLVAFMVTGLFWYLRNFILTQNPYYPANFLIFKGYPNFTQQDWMLWKIPFDYPANLLPLANAFLSEYMIWAFSLPLLIWYLWYVRRKQKTLSYPLKRTLWIALTTGLVCLLLPVTPAEKIDLFHIISDMRYLMIWMTFLMLGVFLLAEQYKRNALLSVVAFLSAIPLFSFLPYQPKLVIIGIALGLLIWFKYPKQVTKLFRV